MRNITSWKVREGISWAYRELHNKRVEVIVLEVRAGKCERGC